MIRNATALELRALLALLAAPGRALTEGALAKAIGRPSRAERDGLLSTLATQQAVVLESGRRGRRVRLTDTGASEIGNLRVPPRARLSGACVNALLAALASAKPVVSRPVRDRLLEAHARLAQGPGGSVTLKDLRESLSGVARADVDDALVLLDREGVLSLGKPIDLAALDEATRAAAFNDPIRGPLVYVSRSIVEAVS